MCVFLQLYIASCPVPVLANQLSLSVALQSWNNFSWDKSKPKSLFCFLPLSLSTLTAANPSAAWLPINLHQCHSIVCSSSGFLYSIGNLMVFIKSQTVARAIQLQVQTQFNPPRVRTEGNQVISYTGTWVVEWSFPGCPSLCLNT